MRVLVLGCIFLMVAGCGSDVRSKSSQVAEAGKSPGNSYRSRSPRSIGGRGRNQPSAGGGGTSAGEAKMSENVKLNGTLETEERKIIYTAKIQLVVDQFDGLEGKVQKTIKQFKGYLASVELNRMQGEHRVGNWTARIPVKNFEGFLEAVVELGVPTSQNQDSQDVTEEFVDLAARVANQKKLETRILELLDRPDDKIQHVIEVERELARVREAIERMEGRLRFLSDNTEMTTVVISAREERDYQPPQAPTIGSRVSSAWSNSIDNTQTALGNFLVNLVGGLIPILAAVIALLVFWFAGGRRLLKWLRTQLSVPARTREPTTATDDVVRVGN